MSVLATNAITDASGGSTATINGYTPTLSNMAGRNRIINGDMRIDQRNGGASVTPADGAYTLDRWQSRLSQASKYSVQQSAVAPTGFNNSLLVTSLSAYAVGASEFFQVRQVIEGFNVADFSFGTASALPITMSFWVRSSLTGTFGGALSNEDGSRTYVFSYTINAANTWEYKTITIPGDTTGTWRTTNLGGFVAAWTLGAGSSVSTTAGSWNASLFRGVTGGTSVVGTSGATFYITGVQLEAGSVATPFEHRQYGQELALCQRYFWTSYPYGTAVGATGQTGTALSMAGHNTSYENLAFVSLPSVMRVTPTGVLYNPSTGAVGSYTADANTYTTYSVSLGSKRIWVHSNGQLIGTNVFTSLHLTASAEL